MPQFPSNPDPSGMPPDDIPEVIIPANGDLEKSSPGKTAANAGVSGESSKKKSGSSGETGEKKTRPPIRFKKRSEAIPLTESRSRRRSRSRRNVMDSSVREQSGNFFEDDDSIYRVQRKYSKLLIVLVALFWFVGVIYILNLGFQKKSTSLAEKNNAMAEAESTPATLDEAYKQVANELKVADDLISMSHNRDALARGTALKLKSLYRWNVLDLSAGRQDNEMHSQLVRATRKHIGHKSESIKHQAEKGLLLLQIKEYLSSPQQEYWSTVAQRFDKLLLIDSDSQSSSHNLMLIADAVAKQGLTNESQQLYKAISRRLGDHANANLARIGDVAEEKFRLHQPGELVAAATSREQERAEITDVHSDPPLNSGLSDSPASGQSTEMQKVAQVEKQVDVADAKGVETSKTREPGTELFARGNSMVGQGRVAGSNPEVTDALPIRSGSNAELTEKLQVASSENLDEFIDEPRSRNSQLATNQSGDPPIMQLTPESVEPAAEPDSQIDSGERVINATTTEFAANNRSLESLVEKDASDTVSPYTDEISNLEADAELKLVHNQGALASRNDSINSDSDHSLAAFGTEPRADLHILPSKPEPEIKPATSKIVAAEGAEQNEDDAIRLQPALNVTELQTKRRPPVSFTAKDDSEGLDLLTESESSLADKSNGELAVSENSNTPFDDAITVETGGTARDLELEPRSISELASAATVLTDPAAGSRVSGTGDEKVDNEVFDAESLKPALTDDEIQAGRQSAHLQTGKDGLDDVKSESEPVLAKPKSESEQVAKNLKRAPLENSRKPPIDDAIATEAERSETELELTPSKSLAIATAETADSDRAALADLVNVDVVNAGDSTSLVPSPRSDAMVETSRRTLESQAVKDGVDSAGSEASEDDEILGSEDLAPEPDAGELKLAESGNSQASVLDDAMTSEADRSGNELGPSPTESLKLPSLDAHKTDQETRLGNEVPNNEAARISDPARRLPTIRPDDVDANRPSPENRISDSGTSKDSAGNDAVTDDRTSQTPTQVESDIVLQLAQSSTSASPSSDNSSPAAIPRTERRATKGSEKTESDNNLAAKQKLELLLQRIRDEVQIQNVTTSTLESAVAFSNTLIEKNSISFARSLLDEVSNAVYLVADGEQRNQVRDKYYSARKRLDSFGRPFAVRGLFQMDGNAADLSRETRELKLVVFWSFDSPVSQSLLEQIERIQAEFASRRIKVFAICEADDSDAMAHLRAKTAEHPSIQFLHWKSGNRASKQFSSRFPVPRYPYLLMLSADNKVVGINVDPVFFDPIGR